MNATAGLDATLSDSRAIRRQGGLNTALIAVEVPDLPDRGD